MEDLLLIYNWKTAVLFAIVVFVIRPLGVFLSTSKSKLNLNEKLFISWVGPRGIVAAGIASLFGINLANKGVPGAEYITPLVFVIVLGTVLLNATTARMFAKIVGVFLTRSEGVMIVGAGPASRLIAKYLADNERHVVLVDTNVSNLEKAQQLGITAVNSNIYSDSLLDDIELSDIGFLMALTGNNEINKYAISKFSKQFGENGAFRLISAQEKNNPKSNPSEGLFSQVDDYRSLEQTVATYPEIHEIEVKDRAHYDQLITLTNNQSDSIPLFIKHPNKELQIISGQSEMQEDSKEGCTLVYLGKELEVAPLPEQTDHED